MGEKDVFKAREYKKVRTLDEAYELNQKRSAMVVGGMMWVKMANFHKMTIIDLSGLGLDGGRVQDRMYVYAA